MNSSWKFIICFVVLFAILTLGIFAIPQFAQNTAFAFEEQVEAALADIEVQEKRRVDLIGNLVDCVKEYDEHEAETLKEVIFMRGTNSAIAPDASTTINAVAESYPELKSNENYKQLMTELALTENLIAEHRSNYNHQIKEYNRYIKKWPTRTFLGSVGYEVMDYEYLEYNAPSDAPQDLFGD